MAIRYVSINLIEDKDKADLLVEVPKKTPFSSVVNDKIIPNVLRESNNEEQRKILSHQNSLIYIQIKDDYIYFVIADESATKRSIFAFLNDLIEKFGMVTNKQNESQNRKLVEGVIKSYNESPVKYDKIAATQQKVEDIQDVLVDTIEKVLKRGEKLDIMAAQTNFVEDVTNDFKKGAVKTKRRACVIM
ncbi:hypothetical protein ABK040_002918 [Willaertia magna]